MASNNDSWIAETVADFIHSPIWGAPINTFIEANCASFDYDDDTTEDDDATPSSYVEEQTNIHLKYQRLADSLIESLGKDLDLDQNELKQVCQLPRNGDESVIIDEPFEQLYAARDFSLFQEMMRRKNLILQLQALVTLQLQWGLLKQSDTGDDLVLSLLLQATSSSSRQGSINIPLESIQKRELPSRQDKHQHNDSDGDNNNNNNDDDDDDDVVVVVKPKQSSLSLPSQKKKEPSQPKNVSKEEYRLPDLRGKSGSELDAKWHRDLQRTNRKKDDNDDSKENDPSKKTSTPQTIGAVSEEVLREKLRELTVRTTSSTNDEATAAIKSRQNFLQQQRELIVNKQRVERARDLEQQTPNARPQSAAHVARKAMATTNTPTNENKPTQESTQIPDDELNKRRAMIAKLKREVVDKR
ncbi:unnamed protein product [Rotaria magnacalcarata]|uniref:Cilia- and flagella-associated protein 36 n=1 Tax=Rotaria magnacalcarata TaxID=392030 RepID=A0A816FVQ0_9BILA|nr:unnamed protein product [Rotaria magnacalcarata]CAF1666088.1 unnamed protein product [Rotaria magnacalcarata]CAF2135348.1 unnamed protein product [Rotaria magnacalcarata]CAF3790935.1 unnamed protein product [Rotaria magnacalcarata]CAF3791233.1 unnamed protein product [Rotaria magnacalcarata]